MSSFFRLSGIVAAAALAGAALATESTSSAFADQPPGSLIPCRTGALAAAINWANGHGGGTFTLSGLCAYAITTPATASDGLPVITSAISLTGGYHTVISRSPAATSAFRIFDVAAGGSLSLTGLSIQNGSTAGLGGGIQNAGTLRLDQVGLSGNTAGNGGALANNSNGVAVIAGAQIRGNTTTAVGGGGILNFGRLTLSSVVVAGNTAPVNGGGLNTQPGGTSTIAQSVFTGNVAGGLGGAISNLGTTSLDRTTVRQNKGSAGGGIATGNTDVTLRDSAVTGNKPDNCSPLNTIPGCAS